MTQRERSQTPSAGTPGSYTTPEWGKNLGKRAKPAPGASSLLFPQLGKGWALRGLSHPTPRALV